MCYIHPHTTTVKTYWFNSIESSKSTRCQNSKWLEEQLSLQLSFYFKTIIMLFLCLIRCVTLSLILWFAKVAEKCISFCVWDGVEIGYPCLLSVCIRNLANWNVLIHLFTKIKLAFIAKGNCFVCLCDLYFQDISRLIRRLCHTYINYSW